MIDSSTKKGFGLIEVLLASVVIIIVVMALLFVGRLAITNSAEAQRRTQATYLAQEAIESIRQIRDTNYIDGASGTGWDQWMNTLRANEASAGRQPTYHNYFVESTGRLAISDQTRMGDRTLGETQFKVYINLQFIDATNILSNPKLDKNATAIENESTRKSKAIVVKAKVLWGSDKEEVRMSELLTDSRQRY